MALLLVDIGNSRIKWARLGGGRLGPRRAAAHLGWSVGDYRRRLLGVARRGERAGRGARAAGGARARGIGQVLVSSVAGPKVNRALAAAAHLAGARVRFVRTPRRGGGVTVGYAEPWRLGVDRFVAAVGAHALFARVPVCVVGVGTAMTIDLVGADGRHRGGVIIPGPALMVETLLDRTQGIRRRARGGTAVVAGRSLFGRSTRAGIVQGARYAAAATIDQAVEQAQALVGRLPLVVLTGGGAPAVRGLLRCRWVLVPDLVLRGLAVLSGS
jgi:type III pantothenate kinase